MIVQPASLGPSGKPRRVLRIVGLVVPVLLLSGVVAAGVLGPSPAPAPPSTAPDSHSSPTRARPRRSASPRTPAPSRDLPVDRRRARRARRPLHARGAQPWHRPGSRRRSAGYLGLDAVPGGCTDRRLGIFGPFCEQIAVLGEAPWYGAAQNAPDAPGFHLHPQFPVGVRMPSQATNVAVSPSTATPPVVIIGRFNDPRARPCEPAGRHCGLELVVERVAWVDGTAYPRRPPLDPLVERADESIATLRRDAALAEAPWRPAPTRCSTALVDPPTIAAIEPRAAPAAAASTERRPGSSARSTSVATPRASTGSSSPGTAAAHRQRQRRHDPDLRHRRRHGRRRGRLTRRSVGRLPAAARRSFAFQYSPAMRQEPRAALVRRRARAGTSGWRARAAQRRRPTPRSRVPSHGRIATPGAAAAGRVRHAVGTPACGHPVEGERDLAAPRVLDPSCPRAAGGPTTIASLEDRRRRAGPTSATSTPGRRTASGRRACAASTRGSSWCRTASGCAGSARRRGPARAAP